MLQIVKVRDILEAIVIALGAMKPDHAKAWVFLRSLDDYLTSIEADWAITFKPDMSGFMVVDKDYRPWEHLE